MSDRRPYKVLIVDDQAEHLATLGKYLREAFASREFPLGWVAPEIVVEEVAGKVETALAAPGPFPYDIIIADVFMPLDPARSRTPDARGGAVRLYEVIKKARRQDEVFLVVMTNRNLDGARELGPMRAEQAQLADPWAIVHYPKPDTTPSPHGAETLLAPQEWKYAMVLAVEHCRDRAWKRTFIRHTLHDIIGCSTLLTRAKLLASRYADRKLIVITGESGSGKELIAKALHRNSRRCPAEEKDKAQPGGLGTKNCQTFNPNTLESELFGHERGAFTGATEARGGLFEDFKNGTVFLDEFGADAETTQRLDKCLRRVLTEPYSFERVGGTRTLYFKGTIILGSFELGEILRAGLASEHLLSRIKGAPRINVPPLRERPEDISTLARYFLREACTTFGMKQKTIAKDAGSLLVKYSWPGNVRELELLMQGLADLQQLEIEAADLPTEIQEYSKRKPEPSFAKKPSPDEIRSALHSTKGNIQRAACMLYQLPVASSPADRDKARQKA